MTDRDKNLARLILENPDMELVVYVDSDEQLMDFAYTAHKIGHAEKSFFATEDEQCYDDEDDYFEHLTDCLEMSENEAKDRIKENGKQVILVKTYA